VGQLKSILLAIQDNIDNFDMAKKQISNGLEVLTFMKNFWKEYSQVEKEYAERILTLRNGNSMNFRGSPLSIQQLQIPQISEKIKTFFVEREINKSNKNENVRVEVESVQNSWNKSKKELEKVAFKHQKFSGFLDEISKPISDILKKESYLLSLIEDGKVLIQRICFVRDKIIELNYATEYEKLQTFRTHNLKEYAEAVKENSKFWDQKLEKESTQKMVDMRSAYNENKKNWKF